MPSWLEGFGFPVAEAVACGVPVVCSTRVAVLESLPQETAVAVDPGDHCGLAEAIAGVLDDPALCSRMTELARQAVKRLTWTECARKTLEVYRSVAGS